MTDAAVQDIRILCVLLERGESVPPSVVRSTVARLHRAVRSGRVDLCDGQRLLQRLQAYMPGPGAHLSVRLSTHVLAQLQAEADRRKVDRSRIVRELIEEGLKRLSK